MCGIAGVAGGNLDQERDAVKRMTLALAHRGPDDSGHYEDEDVVLGNRRLAIIDVSDAGRQPLADAEGRFLITFNGEIYNYRQLRTALEKAGHRFRTHTDTEVLLEMYRRHGADSLHRLRGMFSFAIWDRQERRLFAARDPFGQKPFYYAIVRNRLIFASEIKSILAHGDVPVEPDTSAIDHYLSLRFIPPPLTMFRAIRKLPAGHRLVWNEGQVYVESYFTPDFTPAEARSEDEWLSGLREHIEDAVADHMVSDVPYGAYLSGGLDSGAVVAAMHRRGAIGIPTFCVGSDVPHLDERMAAREMANAFGTVHYEQVASHNVLTRIPRLVRCLDEPSDPIAGCMDVAARLAARNVKVVLGGDGGDEIFGGFDRYAAFDRVAALAHLPAWVRNRVVVPLLHRIPESTRYKSVRQKTAWLASVMTEEGGRQYARMTTHFRFRSEDKRELLGPALQSDAGMQDSLDVIAGPFTDANVPSTLDRMIYADLMTRFPEHTLMLSDRLGMAYGLEIRSPLLDVRLARYCFSMPARLRIRGRTTKYALRRAMREWLPPAALRRPKQGFMLPVADWLSGRGLLEVSAALAGCRLVQEQWVRSEAIERLLREHAARRADHHVRIWMLLSLDAWHRLYIDGEAIESPEPKPKSRAQVA